MSVSLCSPEEQEIAIETDDQTERNEDLFFSEAFDIDSTGLLSPAVSETPSTSYAKAPFYVARREQLLSPQRSTPSPPCAKKNKKNNPLDDAIVNVGQTIQLMAGRAKPPSSPIITETVDDLFGKYIAAELKTFKNNANNSLAKQVIIKAIFELKDEEETKVAGVKINFN